MCRLLACLLLAITAGPLWPQASSGKPFKLEVKSSPKGAMLGETVPVEVTLQDGNNRPVRATKDLKIDVESRTSSGKVVTRQVTFKAGESSKKVEVPADESGLALIRAHHSGAELLDGSTHVLVKRAPIQKAVPPAARRTVKPQAQMERSRAWPDAKVTLTSLLPRFVPQAALHAPLKLLLVSSTTRPPLADGKDRAKIQVFLTQPDEAPADIQVHLVATSGMLAPLPLMIRRGEVTGEAALTCQAVGKVKVRYVRSLPQAQLEGGQDLEIGFAPPIKKLQLKGADSITLIDTAPVIAELQDDDGRPVVVEAPRKISFLLLGGRGQIDPEERVIPPGESSARVSVRPYSNGKLTVSASTPGYSDVGRDILVSLSVALILISVTGGAVGGGLAFGRVKEKLWQRLALGVVVGPLLYWGLLFHLFGSSAALAAAAPNIISVFFFSVAGGYAGSEVISALLKAIGLGK